MVFLQILASLLPFTKTPVPSRTHSPTQQQNTCLTPSVTVVTPSLNPDGITSNSLAPIIQPNPVFQSKPSTLAVPSLVGKTQAVSASKRAFLQVSNEIELYNDWWTLFIRKMFIFRITYIQRFEILKFHKEYFSVLCFQATAFLNFATFYCVEIGIVIYILLCEVNEY